MFQDIHSATHVLAACLDICLAVDHPDSCCLKRPGSNINKEKEGNSGLANSQPLSKITMKTDHLYPSVVKYPPVWFRFALCNLHQWMKTSFLAT